uniref:PHOTOSYSTEM II MANGANESE-STABILIZING POLYPEPTIDE n=1 Tax=Thermosynechococcus vestitus (strain NIES-2133 / IAM M-273 / BP-1) TaxID=197221 RepID=UPI000818CC43|nr:Chain A, PHOTOSYSTEM II MANGANESE-STABILIZING POLYPEPTIDE [Thermosynechococcus vestitus BP-1]5G39_A Chain A, PHOTOSYSTEM II MANGANESE-STABILIZING POLYPEPTIDE [Thermosynechococcus vestitus BP-1]5G3A_A Chain A, PHOTOSYSTEM II MANGANESE-STABILIZING POLYPEPTIDE [Thermosynechococcus vestitus BP-1]
CPTLDDTARGAYPIDSSQTYRIARLCLQPTTFLVKENGEFVPTKLVTRETTSLDQIQGELKVNSDGSLTFVEEDGIDFQPVTVQMAGGERIPLLFTVKNLVASTQPNVTSITTSTDFKGEFNVNGTKGQISLNVAKVDGRTGEIAGTFESEQLSNGHEVKIQGVFYASIEPA